MRKRIVAKPTGAIDQRDDWLDLEQLATVEVTSEDADAPIENALVPGASSGWRAAQPGEQVVRLLFDQPQRVDRVHLRFLVPDEQRTQQFTLRCSDDGGATYRELVRQQWNFSPTGATDEVEDFQVNLERVDALELAIVPAIGGGRSRATLEELRVG